MIHSVANSRRFILSVLLATAPLSACNFREEKDGANDESGDTIDPNVPVAFAEIQSKILQPYCTDCHSVGGGNEAGVNLESYAAVKSQVAAIQRSTVDSTRMPKGSTMSSNLRILMKTWIEQGTPE